MIELRNVTKTYYLGDEKIRALDNVDITIKDGEFVAIVGPSGSGKSTLANIIGGIDVADSGEILIGGQDIGKIRDNALSEYRNKTIGFIFQNFNLQQNYTAVENVAVPLMLGKMSVKERQQRAKKCLEAVGLADRIKHKPHQLSGGQRQRVAIARAIANYPKIIIADEPTGNLDSKKSDEIISLLKDLNREGITLIMITHDEKIASQAKRAITILDGKVKEK
jgi:putative ABC transport system ATP-binding protein